ncbi:abortive phage infection protein [Geothermobacter hydrogeniphilus]|uniref:Abortive phage infection protein n=1 Tax=Geothermobacter hydrogeniphilus TaxID=1969733 RepID=A0A2K2H9E4_9BACT|nr:ATP-binding protein [Geothermobacter hydrogeniphilus]PNU19850.1 abortive phage infection protein [Geothermobacter hydrogeniphilus]
MIVDFTISNFRSIRDEQTFSLYAENPGTHLLDNISYPAGSKIGVLNCAGIYGANASGKSNVLLAFEALQFLIRATGRLQEGAPIKCYEPFRLSEQAKSAPVRFEIEFFTPDGTRYLYKIAFTRKRIVAEHLSFYPSAKAALIFERTEDDTWETIKFGTLFSGGKKRFPFFDNNAYLSKAGSSADAPELIRNVYNYFRKDILRLGLNEEVRVEDWIDNKSIFNKVSALLGFVDTGVSGVVVREKDIDLNSVQFPDNMPEPIRASILRDMKRSFLFVHLAEDEETELFDLRLESAGTRKLFHLAPLIINALESGGVLIVDELDNSMHPFMAELIIRLFNDPDVNCGNAQLIFSTHNISLMSPDHFRRDQIWLTEKMKGATRLFSLEDFDKKKVKPQSPFNRWYAEGRFGAVPKIDYQSIAALLKKSGCEDA